MDGITLARLTNAHHESIDELRAGGPVVWVEALGAWMVLDRSLAIDVLRDAERFTVDDPRFATARVVGPSMLSLDGAEHRRHREPFVAAFPPAAVATRDAPRIGAQARALVGRLAPLGQGDLAADVAGPLAAFSAGTALGLDSVRPATLLAWYRRIVAATEQHALGRDGLDEVGESAARAMDALGMALTDAARDPHGPLAVVADRLDEAELVANAAVFLFGAIETTEGMIGSLLAHLLADVTVLDRVRGDRALLDRAIEESLRLEPAAARVDRYATVDVELGGAAVRRGDLVVVSLAGANHDPAVYARPHEFLLDRSGEPGHLAFVVGPHACIGAQLARIEARAAADAVLDLLPAVRLDGDRGPVAIDGTVFRKPRAVPARWDPPPT